MKNWKLIINFILVVLVQVFLFNEFLFSGYMNPYVYVLYLVLLPTSLSRASVLLVAFAMGLCVDLFENSAGVHAAASVLFAYIRPWFLKILSSRMEETREDITISELGFLSLSAYALLSIFVHHFALFLVESFSLFEIGTVLARTFFSTLFTFIFVVLYQLWNFRRRKL
jgi:rod shape-determining protein MreD